MPEQKPETLLEMIPEAMPDQEWAIRLQFLEEAQDYLDQLESSLLGLGQQKLDREAVDCLLRAAHSTKGGAALMGFEPISKVAHRLEDFFKVLQGGRYEADPVLEQLFLSTVDQMRQMVARSRQHQTIDSAWLAANPQPLLDQLYDQLGDPTPEDEQAALRADAGGDMSVMLFESEIGPCLDRLEGILNDPNLPLLREEFIIACPEMGNLGEMLDLSAFTALCNHAEAIARACLDDQLVTVCQAILKVLRRSHGLVLVGQAGLIPEQVPLPDALGDVLATPITPESGNTDCSEPLRSPELAEGLELGSDALSSEALSSEALDFEALAETLEAAQVSSIAEDVELGGIFYVNPKASLEECEIEAIAQPQPPVTETFGTETFVTETFSTEVINATSAESALGDLSDAETALLNTDETQAPEADAPADDPLELLDIEPITEQRVTEQWVASPESTAPPATAEIDVAALDSLMSDLALEDFSLQALSETPPADADTSIFETSSKAFTTDEPADEAARALLSDSKTSGFDHDISDDRIAEASAAEAAFADDSQPEQEPESSTAIRSETTSSPIASAPVVASGADSAEDVSIRVSVRKLERLGELLGELTTERNGIGLQIGSLKTLFTLLNQRVKSLDRANNLLRQSYDRVAVQHPAQSSSQHTHPAAAAPVPPAIALQAIPMAEMVSGFDQLEMDQYSDLHLVAQEIIESVVQIQEVTTDIELALGETDGLSRELNRTAKQLQLGMNQVRMRPLSEITARFPRMLRQLSLSHGKQAKLQVRGGGTLIERSVIEALQDPLMHLVRNCFDHGIEPPDERVAKGKPPEGSIEIHAGYRGNQVAITVQDDGGGINLDKIRDMVLALGLSLEEIEASGQQALVNLIFEPGFSTADRVTELSGRGVGMDVVRSNLRAVQGDITVDTVPGQGTTFTLTMPLSLSVTRVLVVECQGLVIAFPSNIVEEMLLLEQQKIMRVAEQNLLEWQGYTIPLLHLQNWFHFARPIIKVETESSPVIDQDAALVITQGEEPYAIQCDRYWGEQEVTTRTVEGTLALPRGFSGCVVLGDGRVVPLIDIEKLMDWVLRGAAQAQPPVDTLPLFQASTDKRTVLVVDDSINVRRFLAVTLEKAGYNVEQAKDGQDAIEKLQSGTTPDVVVSDVEMPRLDGFGFLAQVKSLANCEEIPVVMLTSRSGDKHRQLAFSLGAAQYFSKPFKQNELLQTLAELSSASAPAPVTATQSATTMSPLALK